MPDSRQIANARFELTLCWKHALPCFATVEILPSAMPVREELRRNSYHGMRVDVSGILQMSKQVQDSGLALLTDRSERFTANADRTRKSGNVRIGDNSELPRVVFRNRGRSTCHGLGRTSTRCHARCRKAHSEMALVRTGSLRWSWCSTRVHRVRGEWYRSRRPNRRRGARTRYRNRTASVTCRSSLLHCSTVRSGRSLVRRVRSRG